MKQSFFFPHTTAVTHQRYTCVPLCGPQCEAAGVAQPRHHYLAVHRCVPPSTAHHGPHLCVAVLPLRADLGRQSFLAPPANSAHGQNDALQDLPGLPTELPPNLQLHPLSSSPGQPRRAHLQGNRLQLCTADLTHLPSSGCSWKPLGRS